MRFDIVHSRCLAWPLLLCRRWAVITRSSGRVLSRCLLTSVGCGIPDVRRLLVLLDGLAAAALAAVVAALAAAVAVAATAAAATAAWAPCVRRAGPSVGAIVAAGARRLACRRIVVPSLVCAGAAGTLRAGCTVAVAAGGCAAVGSTIRDGARGRVGSIIRAGPCAAVTDLVILVVV